MTDVGPVQNLDKSGTERPRDVDQLHHVETPLTHLVAADPLLADTEPGGELFLAEITLTSQLAQRHAQPLVLRTPPVDHGGKPTTARPLDQLSLDRYRLARHFPDSWRRAQHP